MSYLNTSDHRATSGYSVNATNLCLDCVQRRTDLSIGSKVLYNLLLQQYQAGASWSLDDLAARLGSAVVVIQSLGDELVRNSLAVEVLQ